jgi:hypothetical protein
MHALRYLNLSTSKTKLLLLFLSGLYNSSQHRAQNSITASRKLAAEDTELVVHNLGSLQRNLPSGAEQNHEPPILRDEI